MDGPSASILVVCNPQEAADLVGAVGTEVRLPGAAAAAQAVRTVTADGGDDTVARFVEARPEVVVVAATLDAGDARALIGALRDAAPAGSFHVVLVGDARGPIRNALDAVDFAPDRFVARPVAPKALRFAIATGIAAARRARAAPAADGTDAGAAPVVALPEPSATRLSGAHRAVLIRPGTCGDAAPAPVAPPRIPTSPRLDAMLDAAVDDVGHEEVVRRTSGGFAVPIEAILAAGGVLDEPEPEVTAPTSVHDVPTRPVGALEQRRIQMLDPATPFGARGTTPPPVTIQPRRARTSAETAPAPVPAPAPDAEAPGELSGTHELPPGVEAPVVSEVAGSFDEPPGGGADERGDESPAWSGRGTEDLPPDDADDWDVQPMPPREPTLILSDGAVAAGSPQLDVTERQAGGAWGSAPSVAPVADAAPDPAPAPGPAAEPADLVDDLVEDHLEADLAGLSISRPVPADAAAADPAARPPGGEFARELRRKMSEMAQRLFRGTGAPAGDAGPVDLRPPHDFRTEIDLAALDGAGGGTEVYGLDPDTTFAGDDHGLPTSPGLAGETPAPHGPVTGTSARTSESGELARGAADAATLIARMFASEFTGKIVFRAPARRPEPAGAEGEPDAAEKVIYFDGGRPVFASSNVAADRMGELLYREGKITAEQYAGCRDLVQESGRRMGEILVDRGYLKRRELLPAVRRHVEDVIYSLFAWDRGEYRIVPGDGAQQERIRLSRHPAAMVLEGVRRKLDLATLERLLGPASTVVEVADRDKAGTVVAVADLSADERAALAAMDGSADLGHVARATGAAPVAVYHLAWAMTVLGVATVRRRGVEEDDAPALVGETDLAIDRERVRARHRLVAEADYFALLGVRRDGTAFEIRRAYEAARRDFDVEAFPPELRAELGIELAEIAAVLDEAYRVLRDDRLRGDYLAHLAE